MNEEEEREEWYEFGPYRLSPSERLLLRAGQPVPLTPKAFETLVALIERGGHVVSKEELLRRVWPGTVVEEATLAQNIFTLRKALGEGVAAEAVAAAHYIETVPKRGYRFVAPVVKMREAAAQPEPVSAYGEAVAEEPPASPAETVYPEVSYAGSNHYERRTLSLPSAEVTRADQGGPGGVSLLRRHTLSTVLAAILGITLLGGAALALYNYLRIDHHTRPVSIPFQEMNVARLTTNGKVRMAAISPDGRYVAHTVSESGRESLCVRQIVAGSTICIVPPADVEYVGITFSRDGNYIYYVSKVSKQVLGDLRRIPILGGADEKITSDVDTRVTFSPDGEQLAFMRYYPKLGEAALIVVNKDGSGERKLLSRKQPDYVHQIPPSWSPDGSLIAYATVLPDGGEYVEARAIEVATGQERVLCERRWVMMQDMGWVRDGSGLITVAQDESRLSQIWHIGHPSGRVSRITNDLNAYYWVSVTDDSSALVTVQHDHLSSMWVMPTGDEAGTRQVATGKYDGLHGIAWTPDRRLVYTVKAGASDDLWITDATGKEKRQLTNGAHSNHSPAVSPDGRYLAYVSQRDGVENVWLMELEGGHSRQVTRGKGEINPTFSPDGKWIVYVDIGSGRSALWRIPVTGGEPRRLTDKFSHMPEVSPDGKLIACSYWNEETDGRWEEAIIPFEGGEPLKSFNLHAKAVKWSPDGKALTYVDYREPISNIWSQPLDGSPPKLLTNFKSNRIFNFAWSPDGKSLAYASGAVSRDLVIMSVPKR